MPGTPAASPLLRSRLDLFAVFGCLKRLAQRGGVQAELAGKLGKNIFAEVLLLPVEKIVHFPELAVCGGKLGCFSGGFGEFMLLEREVAEGKEEPVAEVLDQLADDGRCLSAAWALVVAVLDEGESGLRGAEGMVVAGGLDGC